MFAQGGTTALFSVETSASSCGGRQRVPLRLGVVDSDPRLSSGDGRGLSPAHFRLTLGWGPARTEGEGMTTSTSVDIPELLTTAELAALLRIDRSTLSRWRTSGTGPRVTWLTPSTPRYQREDIVVWLRRAAG